jgi:hypothetical protein
MTQFRRFLIPALITFLAAVPASASDLDGIVGGGPEADRLAVLQTLKIYLTVTDDKIESAIRNSFHPTAYLMSVSAKGALRSLTQDFWWERVSRISEDTPVRESKVLIIDVSGHAAIARIDIKNGASGDTTTDYFNLQKVAAGWRIVNKTLSEPI